MTSELDPDDEHVLMICGHAKPSACAEAVAHAGAPEDHPCGPSDAATPEAAAATGAFCEVLLANHTATEHGELLLHGAARVESVATAHDAAIAAGEMPEVPTIHLEIVDADDFAEMMNLAKETVASFENPVELEAALASAPTSAPASAPASAPTARRVTRRLLRIGGGIGGVRGAGMRAGIGGVSRFGGAGFGFAEARDFVAGETWRSTRCWRRVTTATVADSVDNAPTSTIQASREDAERAKKNTHSRT